MSATIQSPAGAAFARILSIGSYRPERVVTNAEVCERIDSTDEWIRERSGIVERRYAAPDESVVDMAVSAAEKALASAGISADQVGFVLVATVTHPYPTPSASAEVAYRLGATNAGATDISSACAGFCYGLAMAQDMVRGGSAMYVVLVGVEKLTDWIDLHDRSTGFIFADGAGAVVVGPSDEAAIGPVVWGSDGSQQVFRWAVSKMAVASQEALDRAGVTADQLDAFIPHQANMRITDAMIRALHLPEHVAVARDIETTGNTSAASVPIAMDRMLSTGEAPHGGTALLIGFGAGLAYAAQVVTLP